MLLFFYLSSPGQVKRDCNFAQIDRCKWGFTGFKNGFKSSAIMHQQLERQYPDYTASIEERIMAGVKRSVVIVRDRERGILN